MAVRRSYNALNQVRVSVPDIRGVESAVRSDFDELLKGLLTGIDKSYVVKGFEIEMAGSIGSSATSLQVIVEGSTILNGNSATSGTFYVVPEGTPSQTLSSTINPKVIGSFTPGSQNYIGLEYVRQVDNSTSIQRYFWSPATKSEFVKTAPQGELMDYRFVISSSIFPSNILPLAVVETDSANNVLSVEDRRPMLFRLGTAGILPPDPAYQYKWDNHVEGRSENPSKSTSSTLSPFRGGDKQIFSMKEMFDALMTEVKLIKGAPFWYSQNAGGSLYRVRTDLANTLITSKGSVSHSQTVQGRINWSNDIELIVVGSRLRYVILANPSSSHITLANDEVAYITLIRDVNIVPNLIWTNASATVTSVGAVPWTSGLVAGDYIKSLFAGDDKYYQILSVDSPSQVTLTEAFQEASTGITGIKSQYAWGVYETSASPSTNRHVKIGTRSSVAINQDNYWLYARRDNGIVGPQQSQIVTTADIAGSLNNTIFRIYSNDNLRKSYFILDNGTAVDPNYPNETAVRVPIADNMTDAEIAFVLADIIEEQTDFSATVVGNTVTVTNELDGVSFDIEDVDTGFSLSTISEGTKAKVYARFFGSEIEQGETRQISDNESAETINYIGARSEADGSPSYSSAFEQITLQTYRIVFPSAASINSGDAIKLKSTNNIKNLYLWFNKDAVGGNPSFLDEIPIEVAISTGFTNIQVAFNAAAALTASGEFNVTNNGDGSLTISPLNAGRTINPENVSVTGASIEMLAFGSGESNHYVEDGQNLTQAIKRLDQVLYTFLESFKQQAYEEHFTVVSTPTTLDEIAPTLAGNIISIPLDTNKGNSATSYVVGDKQLEVFLNGQYLQLGEDYLEVGSVGDKSVQIEILFDLILDDVIRFRIDNGTFGNANSTSIGGGEANTASNVGVTGAGVFKAKVGLDLQFKRIVQGAGTSISEGPDSITISSVPTAAVKNVQTVNGVNYSATVSDDYIRVLNSGSDLTVTLPNATTPGKEITIKKIDSGNTLSIATVGGETIDGINATLTPLLITIQNESVTVIYNGATGWEII